MNRIEEWDTTLCEIYWWKEGRTKLNKVIRKYNKWVRENSDDLVKTAKLLDKINDNLEMHYCNQSGGSGWKEELLTMKSIVESRLKEIA